ncbi:alpha-amylase family glycosyl hydrolase [Aquilutibacter rugosus]|uniref:alpha-amylase family glycosyl hydrolase n=1 Tax=Aquilutibacter rugosus TaxID=3115820 RepID=UPI002F420C62
MTDRFADGNPGNNNQHADEYDPADGRKWSGGDLAGVQQRLDYIQGLGATAVWITPPVRNLWWNVAGHFGGYHGYWANHFQQVDPHYGTLADYKRLADALHARDMRLVQDIVVNHTGNYTQRNPQGQWVRTRDSAGLDRPLQKAFADNLSPSSYHLEPSITDFTDTTKLWNGQLADLDDLNTESPHIRKALRQAYGYWMREVGVDAFRVDTAFYVPPSFFDDFMHAADPEAPGIARVAKDLNKPDFLLFGEGFAIDKPYRNTQDHRIAQYLGPKALPSMINFTYYGTSLDVFARGAPTAALLHRLQSQPAIYGDTGLMPTFVDNHDVDRFLAQSNTASLRQALLGMFTVPGIPVIYYGTEQSMSGQRDSMFAGGFGSAGRDHFDTDAPLYRYIAQLASIRKSHRALTHGQVMPWVSDQSGPGLLGWRMQLAGEPSVLVLMNTADTPRLLTDDGAQGMQWLPLGETPEVAPVRGTVIPGKAAWVFVANGTASVAAESPMSPAITTAPPTAPVSGVWRLQGTGPATHLIADGRVQDAIPVSRTAEGWTVTLDTRSWTESDIAHQLVARDERSGALSAPLSLRASNPWQSVLNVTDPRDDDHGPLNSYTYPAGADWQNVRSADLLGAQLQVAGTRLRLTLPMRMLSSTWNPANGFDHVSLQVYLQVPGVAGKSIGTTYEQRGQLPCDFTWNRLLRIHGWSNALFAANDRGEAVALSETATAKVDRSSNTITLEWPASALGSPSSLSGTQLWINTWDYDGGLRPLTAQATPGSFGGGQGADDPMWMDAIGPLTLP